MHDNLRVATEAEFQAVRSQRRGIYATRTDLDGEFGSPSMQTSWFGEDGEPLCAMVTRGFEPGESWTKGTHTLYVRREPEPRELEGK